MSFKLTSFVQVFIFTEFFIVVSLLFFTYFLRFYYMIKRKADLKISKEIELAFIEREKTGVLDFFRYRKHVGALVDVFLNWDKTHQDSETWNKNKENLMKEKILPLVVEYINHHHWSKRFLLLRCFDYYVDVQYEPIIIKLIWDKFSIISISATHIAVALGSRTVLIALLERICLETGHFQTLYITQLKASPLLYELITEKLKSSQESHTRESCYRILGHIGVKPSFYEMAFSDLKNNDLELKLSAIRILPDANPVAATPILMALLEDDNWIVRNTAIKSMVKLNKKDILSSIEKACHDPAWWVRVNAAKILSKFGEESQAFIKAGRSAEEMASFQEAQYFLKIRNIEGH